MSKNPIYRFATSILALLLAACAMAPLPESTATLEPAVATPTVTEAVASPTALVDTSTPTALATVALASTPEPANTPMPASTLEGYPAQSTSLPGATTFPACARALVAPLGFVDNTRLVGQALDGVNIIELETGQEADFLAFPSKPPHYSLPFGIALAPDGETVAWSLEDVNEPPPSTLQLVRLSDHTTIHTLSPITPSITHLAFSAAGDKLFGLGFGRFEANSMFMTWGLDGQLLSSLDTGLGSYHGFVTILGMGVSPDGRLLAFVPLADDPQLLIWDLVAQKQMVAYPTGNVADEAGGAGGINVTFSPDGRLVGHGTGYGFAPAAIWRVSDGALVWRASEVETPPTRGNFAFSPDGQWLAAPENDNGQSLAVLRAVAGTTIGERRILPLFEQQQFSNIRFLFTPDSTRLVATLAAERHTYMAVWDVETAALQYLCEAPNLDGW